MSYYIIIRSHYYGPKGGPWRLLVEESGEPLTFVSRKEAIAAIDPNSLQHSEYACEIMILSDGNSATILLERRLNTGSAERRL